MRILLLSPDYRYSKAFGSELFRDEIALQHEVVRVVGPAALNPTERVDVPELLEKHGGEAAFDLLMVHHLQYSRQYDGIAGLKIPTCCYVVDFFPRHYDYKADILERHDFDMLFLTQQMFLEPCEVATGYYKHTLKWLPFSVDPSYFTTHMQKPTTRSVDVTALMSAHAFEYPQREETINAIANLHVFNSSKITRVARLVSSPSEGIYHGAYARLLGDSKIAVASIDQHGSCNMRHYEIPAAGAMLLTDGPPKDFEALGFKEGEHYVLYRDVQELKEKIAYYFYHDDERMHIAAAGQRFVLDNHTNEIRVQQLTRIIEEELLG